MDGRILAAAAGVSLMLAGCTMTEGYYGYAPDYGYAPSYGYGSSYGYRPSYGYGYGSSRYEDYGYDRSWQRRHWRHDDDGRPDRTVRRQDPGDTGRKHVQDVPRRSPPQLEPARPTPPQRSDYSRAPSLETLLRASKDAYAP